jgi:hypothetical protein
MLMIRDIANPSVKDIYFPVFRQKDWYLGNSWASGIALFGGRPYLNGRNQESSSEAIAAYEAVAMYGSTMMKAFGNGKSISASDNEAAYTACQVFNIGRFLATTEIRSADRYWHVYSPKKDEVYPDSYTPAVVSMRKSAFVLLLSCQFNIQVFDMKPLCFLNFICHLFDCLCKTHVLTTATLVSFLSS